MRKEGRMKRSLFVLFLLLALTAIAAAQWSSDPSVNTPVCTAPDQQTQPQVISDGLGGAIIVWQDLRDSATTGSDIYAQRFDASGNPKWSINGIPVCTATGDQLHPQLCGDDSGGAIITWEDYRLSDCPLPSACSAIYAQHINLLGNPVWTADGVQIVPQGFMRENPKIAPDGLGGAIIAWEQNLADTIGGSDIYARHLYSFGNVDTVAWGSSTDGLPICQAMNDQNSIEMISDGNNGAVIVWQDYRSDPAGDIYGQRVDGSGNILWAANGIAISSASGPENQFKLASDLNHGVIVTYIGPQIGDDNTVRAELVRANGTLGWGSGSGISVTNLLGFFGSPAIVSDTHGGAIISWSEFPDLGIEAQRLDTSGAGLWNVTGGGIVVCNQSGIESAPSMVPDGAGGSVVSWQDTRNGNKDIYAQRVSAGGTLLWISSGLAVSTASGDQGPPRSVPSNTNGSAIIAWEDTRNGSGNTDIYCNLAHASSFIVHIGALPALYIFDPTISMNVKSILPTGSEFDVVMTRYFQPPDPCLMADCFDPASITGIADKGFWQISAMNVPPGTTFQTDITFTFANLADWFGRPPNPNMIAVATRDSGGQMFERTSFNQFHPQADQIVAQNITHFSQWILAVVPESASYRSIQPESIATARDNKGKLGKAVKLKPDKVEFCTVVTNHNPGAVVVNGLHMEFSHKILPGTISATPPYDSVNSDAASHKWNFFFSAPIDSGGTISVCGFGDKGSRQTVSKYWWISNGVQVGKPAKDVRFTLNQPRLPMPNLINLIDADYQSPALQGGLVIGIADPTLKKTTGWVRLKKSGDVLKSLVGKKGSQHTGDPAAFDFTGEKGMLPPEKQNDNLFANQVAAKLALTSSDDSITPPGFSGLTYDDSTGAQTHPLNGKGLWDIVTVVDSFLSGYHTIISDCTEVKPAVSLDSILRRINRAFSGPVDTNSFSGRLSLKGILRDWGDIPYLHPPAGITIPLRNPPVRGGERPVTYSLYQNYPNPFNPVTVIRYFLPVSSIVTLKIYNILGQEVMTLLDEQILNEGVQSTDFDGSKLASGVYFYRLSARPTTLGADAGPGGGYTAARKMLLIK